MANITFTVTVPNDKATDILDTVTDYLGYGKLDEIGKPFSDNLTKKQYLDLKIKEFIKDCYKRGKANSARNAVSLVETTADAVEITV